jgi:hypothetical protein
MGLYSCLPSHTAPKPSSTNHCNRPDPGRENVGGDGLVQRLRPSSLASVLRAEAWPALVRAALRAAPALPSADVAAIARAAAAAGAYHPQLFDRLAERAIDLCPALQGHGCGSRTLPLLGSADPIVSFRQRRLMVKEQRRRLQQQQQQLVDRRHQEGAVDTASTAVELTHTQTGRGLAALRAPQVSRNCDKSNRDFLLSILCELGDGV